MAYRTALLAAMLSLVFSLEAQDTKRTVTPPYNVTIISLNLFVTLHWKHEEEGRVNFSAQVRGHFNSSTWDDCPYCISVPGTQCDVTMCVSYGFHIFRVRAERRVGTLDGIFLTSDWALSRRFNQDIDGHLGKPSLHLWSKANKVFAGAETHINPQVDLDEHVTYNFTICKGNRCWQKQGASNAEVGDGPGNYCVMAVALYDEMYSKHSSSECIMVKGGGEKEPEMPFVWVQVMTTVFGIFLLALCVALSLRYCHRECQVPQLPKVLQDLSMSPDFSEELLQEPWCAWECYDIVEEVVPLEKQTPDIPAEAVMPQGNQKQPLVIYRGYSLPEELTLAVRLDARNEDQMLGVAPLYPVDWRL
uniref:uncharacterized protein n=1 Tax=Myxine glutinosa TaxID=7769 RepID=UPI00358F39D1